MENVDCIIFLIKERKRGTNLQYLSFVLTKQRYRNDSGVFYFSHPFAEDNTMQLMDDVGLAEPLSETSLQSEFVDDASEFKRTNMKERLEVGKMAPSAPMSDINDIYGKAI